MDVNEHDRLSSLTFRHKLKKDHITFIAILHFTVSNDEHKTYVKMTVKWRIAYN